MNLFVKAAALARLTLTWKLTVACSALLTEEQGSDMCFLVISKRSKLVKASWPAAALECQRCLEPTVLNGNSMADNLVKAGK